MALVVAITAHMAFAAIALPITCMLLIDDDGGRTP